MVEKQWFFTDASTFNHIKSLDTMKSFTHKSTLLTFLLIVISSTLISCNDDRDDYVPVPVIVSLQPEVASPGQTLTILGGNFSANAAENIVTINGVPVTVKTAKTNSLEIIIPDNATDGVLSVTVNGQTGSARDLFDVIDELAITAVSPEKATKYETITISGQFFGLTIDANEVKIQDVVATITNATSTELKVTVPEATSLGQATISIAANNQSVTHDSFEVIDYPTFSTTNSLKVSEVDFSKISIASANVAYAVGDDGLIAKSTSPGTWELVSYGSTDFKDVHAFDEQNVLVCGYDGLMVKTTDGGATWSEVMVGTTDRLRRMHFISKTAGWVVGSEGIIFKTIDGGKTWQSLDSGVDTSLYGVFFIDDNNGFVVGDDDHVLKTTDGGETWETTVLTTGEDFRGVGFIDTNKGWVVGKDNVLLHTNDGGETWVNQNISLIEDGNDFNDITILSENNIIAVADDHQLAQSEDGGVTWKVVDLEKTLKKTVDLHLEGVDSYRGIAVIVGEKGFVGY